MGRILVVNPNSSPAVTDSIVEALRAIGDCFDVVRREDGPQTIRTDEDVVLAGHAFAERVADTPDADAYITACFSDPGLDLAREGTGAPVVGAQEAAVLEACELAERFGIIALSERAIPRHLKRIAALGVMNRLVAEMPLSDVSAEDSGCDPAVYGEILGLAADLRDRGAGAIVLGCAGMAQLAARLQKDLGVPVIDPVAAAGKYALALVEARKR